MSVLILGSLVGGPASAATVVNYTIASGTGDSWTGTFEIPDMSAVAGVDPPTVSTITAVSGTTNMTMIPAAASADPGSAGVTWSNWVAPHIDGMDIYSLSFFNLLNGGATWNNVVATGTFALDSADFYTDSGETGALSTIGGVLTFSAVPEPSTCASLLAGLACGGYSVFRRRKRA